jgi:hypothetical protein
LTALPPFVSAFAVPSVIDGEKTLTLADLTMIIAQGVNSGNCPSAVPPLAQRWNLGSLGARQALFRRDHR